MRDRKRQLLIILGIVISALFLWIAFRGLHPEAILDSIRGADGWWLLASVLMFLVSTVIIALRWGFLLSAVKSVPLTSLTALVTIGYMGNNVYPFRSGEALRIYLLRRNHQVPIARGAVTVIVERVFDGLVMLTFIALPLLFIDLPSDEVRTVALIAAPLFVTATAIFFVMAARPALLRWLLGLLPGKIGQVAGRFGGDIAGGLEGLRSPGHLAGAALSSYGTWAVQGVVYWMVAFAFNLEVSFWVALLAVGAVNLAGLIPASPGQIGVFEFFASTVMIAAGVPETQAAAYALAVHGVVWLPMTLAGFVLLVRQGLGWRAIARARELEEQASTAHNSAL
jgi:glycosyltransferase 2 family protein